MTITDTEPTVVAGTLTKDDLHALRVAEVVSFHVYRDQSYIRASLSRGFAGEQRIYSAKAQMLFPQTQEYGDERNRQIDVPSKVWGYHDMSSWQGDDKSTAFSMVHSAQYSHTWRTIAEVLRVGDEVTLDFCGDAYSNGNTKDVGIHVDRLLLIAQRGPKRLTFIVAVAACYDNSARMVKRHGG